MRCNLYGLSYQWQQHDSKGKFRSLVEIGNGKQSFTIVLFKYGPIFARSSFSRSVLYAPGSKLMTTQGGFSWWVIISG